MGRKKMLGAAAATTGGRPFCYYCDRNFEDETVLLQHQRAKHFRCSECESDAIRGKCESVQGLIVHTLKVHGKGLDKVPNAQQGRDDPELNVYGMDGVPEDILLQKGFQPPPPIDEPQATKLRTEPPPPVAPPFPGFPGLPGPPFPGMPPLPGMQPHEFPGFPGLPAPSMQGFPGLMAHSGTAEMPGFPGLPSPPGMPNGLLMAPSGAAEMPGFPGLPSPPVMSNGLPGFPGLPSPPGMSHGLPGSMPAFSMPAPSPDFCAPSNLPPLPALMTSMPIIPTITMPTTSENTFPNPPVPAAAPPQLSGPPISNGHEAAKVAVAPPPLPIDGEDDSVEEMRARLQRYRVLT